MEAIRKHSKKREAIMDALRGTKEHPSAEMLYSWLKPHYPDLSLGTVYRNLAVFMDSGDIISVGAVAGQERYDATTAPHAHFVCEKCARVLDLDVRGQMDDLYRDVEKQAGGTVRTHSLTFTGLCENCADKEA